METTYYTPKEVAERLQLRVQTVYEYIRAGRLPAVRLGNRCRIAGSDLEAFLARRQSAAPDSADQAGTASRGEDRQVTDHVRDDLHEQVGRNEAARRLLAEWMADESGYDEEAWPTVERLLEKHPVSMGDRRDG